MTLDEAIADARKRVPVDVAADHSVVEINLQIGQGCANCEISRDTFAPEVGVTVFLGSGKTPQEAIAAAIADYETTLTGHASDCALHNEPAAMREACNCGRPFAT